MKKEHEDLKAIVDSSNEDVANKEIKKKLFYFDGKIDIANILTICALIIAFFTLQNKIKTLKLSEQSLSIKVEEMSKVLDRLDKAEIERMNLEVKTMNSKTTALEGNLQIWDWVLNQNNDREQIENNNYFELSLMIQEIYSSLKAKNIPDANQMKVMKKLEEINIYSIAINTLSEEFSNKTADYKIKNEPSIKENESQKEFNIRLKKFTDDYASYSDSLQVFYFNKIKNLGKQKHNLFNEIVQYRKLENANKNKVDNIVVQ